MGHGSSLHRFALQPIDGWQSRRTSIALLR
jgi:hypothetical protein